MLVAAFGVIPATVGAASQELVDLLVVLNALRALGARRDKALTAAQDAKYLEK